MRGKSGLLQSNSGCNGLWITPISDISGGRSPSNATSLDDGSHPGNSPAHDTCLGVLDRALLSSSSSSSSFISRALLSLTLRLTNPNSLRPTASATFPLPNSSPRFEPVALAAPRPSLRKRPTPSSTPCCVSAPASSAGWLETSLDTD